ncbi:hypothetical protein [Geodermatophilus sp. SYSU D00815]
MSGPSLEDRVRALLDDFSPAERTALAPGDWTPLTARGLPHPLDRRAVVDGTHRLRVAGDSADPGRPLVLEVLGGRPRSVRRGHA